MDYSKVIAVDFDGTLCTEAFPDTGERLPVHDRVIAFLHAEKAKGALIVLWTCREDTPERNYLSEAAAWCRQNSVPIDYVNERPLPEIGGFPSRKLWADLYIDDKSVNLETFLQGVENDG